MDYPASFASAMIKGLLAGSITQTRRPAYRQAVTTRTKNPGVITMPTRWAGMRRGDRLWVREGFYSIHKAFAGYKADGPPNTLLSFRNHPAMQMPRHLSRMTLMIIEPVKIAPLKSITEEEAAAVGVSLVLEKAATESWGDISPAFRRILVDHEFRSHRMAFKWAWDRFYGLDGWRDNADVAVIRFVAYQVNIDEASSSLAAE